MRDRKLIYLHGFSNVGHIPSPDLPYIMADMPRQISVKPYHNFNITTDGEMSLLLLQEEIDIFSSYYGDTGGHFARSRDMIMDALHHGLHTGVNIGHYARNLSEQEIYVAKAIRDAKKKFTQGNIDILGYRHYIGAPDPAFNDKPIVPMADCEQFIIDDIYEDQYGNQQEVREFIQPQYRNCLATNRMVQRLNDDLEKVAHHLLYEFATVQEGRDNGFVAAKTIEQKTIIDSISDYSNLSRSNLNNWLNIAIRRANVNRGLEPHSGIQTKDFIRLRGQLRDDPRIGLDPATIALIITAAIQITTIIAAATQESRKLKNQIITEEQALQLELKNMGLTAIEASTDDWNPTTVTEEDISSGSAGSSSSSNASIGLVALLLGGAFLMRKK